MEYISFSQISMFLKCGEQWRRRYIEKEISPPAIAMVKGRSIHQGIEYNGRQKIESRIDLPKQEVIDFAVASFDDDTLNTELFLSEDEKGKGKALVLGESKDKVAKMAELYCDEIAPSIQPIAVEEKVMIEFPEQKPIMAIMDLIDEDIAVHDFKYSGKSKNQKDLDEDLQFTIYSLACKEKTGQFPSKMIMDVLVDTKVPKHQQLTTYRSEDSYLKIMRLSGAIQDAISKGVFLPAKTGEWWCSERFCGYWHNCKYVHSKIIF